MHGQNFMRDMEGYINCERFSDITLVSSDGEKVYGHKIILSRVPYFENLFKLDLRESFQKEVNLDKITHKTLMKIIKYIYTSACNFGYDESVDLYEAANYLGLEDLKKMCEEKILSIASVDNACDILLVTLGNFKLESG